MVYLLDDSEIDKKITPEEKRDFWRDFDAVHKSKFQRYSVGGWFLVNMLLLFLIVTMLGALVTLAISWQAFALWMLGNLAFYVVMFGIKIQLMVRRRIKIHRMAKQSGCEVIFHKAGKPGYSGLIFDDAKEARIVEAVRFDDGLEVGTFEYYYGGGSNRWMRTFGYMRMPIKKHLPNMLLDSRANNTFGLYTGFTLMYSGREQRDSLEGDFDKHFRLFAPGGYQIDTRYLLTPNVMAAFIDYGSEYDFEVIDDHIQLYSRKKINLLSSAQMSSLLKIADVVAAKLGKQAKRYSDERVTEDVYAPDGIAVEGQRLKPSLWLLYVYLAIFVGAIALAIFG